MSINMILFTLKRLVNRRLFMILGLIALLFLGLVAVLYYQVDARSQREGTRQADTLIVLGAAVWPNERPGPSLVARMQHAITLYKAGYAPNIIVSGGLGQYPPTEAEVMRRLAIAAGIPDEAVVLEDRSNSTETNLANSQVLMKARGWHSAVIVSDGFHLYRAELIAHDLGMDATGSPALKSSNNTVLRSRVYYTTRESLALIWYGVTRVTGEPEWLYALLKGHV